MAVVNFLWDDTNLLEEFSDGGAVVAHYVTEPDQYGNVVSQRRSSQSSYFHYEAVGSTTEVSNSAGSVTDTRRYTAFGETVEESGATEFQMQFVGRVGYYYDDDSKHHYIRRRSYRPFNGQWLTIDPISHVPIYIYVSNSPVNTVDPSGLISIACLEDVAIKCGVDLGVVKGYTISCGGLCRYSPINSRTCFALCLVGYVVDLSPIGPGDFSKYCVRTCMLLVLTVCL